jgi:hypothetical protein
MVSSMQPNFASNLHSTALRAAFLASLYDAVENSGRADEDHKESFLLKGGVSRSYGID